MIIPMTWADRVYSKIPQDSKYERINWHQQRLIQEKYPDVTKAPTEYANLCNFKACGIVEAEDLNQLPL